MYDIERVRKEFFQIAESQGVLQKVPVNINGRLTRTLGRVCGAYNGNHEYYTTRVEFSRQFLETATDECIYSVIQHECAHFIVNAKTKENHGHDRVFKDCCAQIGCDNDKTTTHVDRTIEENKIFKYQIYCHTCDRVITNYSRMNNSIRNISRCYCKTCGQYNLSVIQNW